MKKILFLLFCVLFLKGRSQVQITMLSQTKAKCFGVCDGSATFSITGAPGPYSVVVTNTPACTNPTVAAFNGSTVTINNICPCPSIATAFNFYNGGGTNFLGTAYAVFAIPATAPLTVTTNIIPASCPTCCDGKVYCIANGGSTSSGPTVFYMDGNYLAMFFWPATGVCTGTHTLCGVDNLGCQVCITFTMGFSTGIKNEEIAFQQLVLIYPNPSGDKILYSGVTIEAGSEFILTDIRGREIRRQKTEINTDSIEIDLSEVESGLFFLGHFLKDGTRKTNSKIVVN